MSKFVFKGYGRNLFDVIIAHFVAVFVSVKWKILEVSHHTPVLKVG